MLQSWVVHADMQSQNEHVWKREAFGSGAYYGMVLAGTVVAVIFLAAGGGRVVAIVALAALGLWYVTLGRAAGRANKVMARGTIYVTGNVALLAIAQAATPWSSFMLFAFCPQCFVLLPAWWATGAVAAFSLIPILRLVDRPGLALSEAGIALAVIAFSATFGRWIIRIIEQSTERAELIKELANARDELAGAEYNSGVLAERQRLAAEIHDTLAQGLTSIIMLLQAADAAGGEEQARAYLGQAARTARENLAEARGLITDQLPAPLHGSPLDEALRRLTARLAEETGIAVGCEVTGDHRWLPSAIEVVMLRCAQEALANVRKHSRATNVTLRLDYGADEIRLRVSDDGVGFDPAPGRGLGLSGMSKRVAQAGGVLGVWSSPGAGTTLSVQVPA
jgi:signal transduction histidine kinase